MPNVNLFSRHHYFLRRSVRDTSGRVIGCSTSSGDGDGVWPELDRECQRSGNTHEVRLGDTSTVIWWRQAADVSMHGEASRSTSQSLSIWSTDLAYHRLTYFMTHFRRPISSRAYFVYNCVWVLVDLMVVNRRLTWVHVIDFLLDLKPTSDKKCAFLSC